MFDENLNNMETMHTEQDINWKGIEKSHKRGKIIGGLLIVTAGSLFLARELGADIPHWIFTWKTFLIALGVFIGFKHSFRRPSWFIFIAIGVVFLIADLYPTLAIKPILWPVLLIVFGLFMIFKPRRKHNPFFRKMYEKKMRVHCGNNEYDCYSQTTTNKEDFIDSTTFMAGVKKNILSKNFKGGDITNVFGGTELNMSQADIESAVTLELTNIFGGTKLIIPAHWEINSELVSVFGSIEDKRPTQPNTSNEPLKTLIIKGTTFFGGIEIKSF